MRRIVMILGLALAGCAATKPADQADRPERSGPPYTPAAAAALAFDPPLAMGLPLPDFSRDGRAPEAFAGYEDQITTYSYTRQRDEIRVRTDFGELDRRAYTDRVSITTR